MSRPRLLPGAAQGVGEPLDEAVVECGNRKLGGHECVGRFFDDGASLLGDLVHRAAIKGSAKLDLPLLSESSIVLGGSSDAHQAFAHIAELQCAGARERQQPSVS